MRKYLKIKAGGETVKLRLTVAGQRELSDKFHEETLQTVISAGSDSERMVALLDAALNWKGSENPVTEGEELYDLLVDEGYAGIGRFSSLALDIARVSGIVDEQQRNKADRYLSKMVDQAFSAFEQTVDQVANQSLEDDEGDGDAKEENPTTEKP